jgi:hypothetical protein
MGQRRTPAFLAGSLCRSFKRIAIDAKYPGKTIIIDSLNAGSLDGFDQLALEHEEKYKRWHRDHHRRGHGIVPGGGILFLETCNCKLYEPEVLIGRDC